MKVEEKTYIGFKDIILVIGLTLLISIIQVILTLPFSAAPFLLAYLAAPCSMLVSGSVFVLLMNKAPYRGTMLLFICITCLPMLFMGGAFLVPVLIMVLGGFIGEFVFIKDSKRTQGKLTIAYCIYAVCQGVGTYAPTLFIKDSLIEQLKDQNVPQKLIDDYNALYSVGPILGAVALTIVCAIIGIFLGTKLFKKHFDRIN